jgi:O-antigen ligase
MTAGLVLPSIIPDLSRDLMIPMFTIGLVVWLAGAERAAILRQPAVFMPLLAGMVLLLASAVTAKSPLHVVAPLVFAHLYLIGALVALYRRLGPSLSLTTIGMLALLGALGGAVLTGFDVLVLGSERGGLVNNPIRMAALTLPLGFTALVGLWGQSGAWRWCFLAGPVLGLLTAYFTGSRGPILAGLVMAAIAVSAICITQLPRRRAIQFHVAAGVLMLFAAGMLIATSALQTMPLTDDIAAAMRGDGSADGSTTERLNMYGAAYQAFLASPWVGHGFIDYIRIAETYAAPGRDFIIYDHLHNDIANFSVVAGVMGILAYGLFMFGPLLGALRTQSQDRGAMIYLGAVTSIGFVCLGATDTTIGVHWQNVVLATISAIIATLALRSKVPV